MKLLNIIIESKASRQALELELAKIKELYATALSEISILTKQLVESNRLLIASAEVQRQEIQVLKLTHAAEVRDVLQGTKLDVIVKELTRRGLISGTTQCPICHKDRALSGFETIIRLDWENKTAEESNYVNGKGKAQR